MSRRLLLLGVLALAACGNKGTFVVVEVPSGPPGIARVDLDLTLGGEHATAQFSRPAGVTYPISGSLEIVKGSGLLTITANATDSNGTLVAQGTATATVVRGQTVRVSMPLSEAMEGDMAGGGLSITPKMHGFGLALVDTTGATQRFTVTNDGTMTTGALMVAKMGMDAADFTIVEPADCLGKALMPGGTCTVDVTFAPKTGGDPKTAALIVRASDGTFGGMAAAALAGKAAPKSSATFNEAVHNFPNTLVGTTSSDVTFTLTNNSPTATGTVAITLSGSNAGEFEKPTASDLCNGKMLPGNSSCTVVVRSKPTVRGMASATLEATENGAGAVVTLNGKGVIPAKLVIVNGATMGAPANLGTVDVDTTGATTHNFMLRNDGDFPTGQLNLTMTPGGMEIEGVMPGTTCNPLVAGGGGGSPPYTVLDPTQSCNVSIALRPSSFGVKNVAFDFSSSPGGAVSTYVTGVGRDVVTLNVARSGSNGADGTISDTATPTPLDCGPAGTVCQRVYTRTTTVPQVALQATPAGGSNFDSWSGVTCMGGASGNPCQFMLGQGIPAGMLNVTANFSKPSYALNYNRIDFDYGGAAIAHGDLEIDVSPGITCAGECSGTAQVPANSTVTVTAKADATPLPGGGFALRRITGACNATSINGADASCSFSMNSAKNIDVMYSVHNFAFITSSTSNAKLNPGGPAGTPPTELGLNAADARCQSEADANRLPGTFKAWLSATNVDAKDRVSGGSGWLRSDGRPFAHSHAKLIAGRTLYPLMLDAGRTARPGGFAFTATSTAGTRDLQGFSACADWTDDASADNFLLGNVGEGAQTWTAGTGVGGPNACLNLVARIYCFGTDLKHEVAPLNPAGNRLAFVTSTTRSGNATGIGDLDAYCAAAAATNTALNGHMFKAFATGDAAVSGKTASGRFSAAGPPWIRLDGVLLGFTPGAILNNPGQPTAAFDVDEQGINIGYPPWVWTGGPNPTITPFAADNCNDWTNGTSGWFGNAANPGKFFGQDGFGLGTCSSTTLYRVYCLEP